MRAEPASPERKKGRSRGASPRRSALAELDAFVLCGGFGGRLRSTLGDVPKALAPIAGRPFLDLLLEQLARQGLRSFVLCAGHGSDAVLEAASGLGRWGRVAISVEPRPLGTGGALLYALPHARANPILVVNGDSLALVDLAAMLAFHRKRAARVTLALSRHRGPLDGGRAVLDPANRALIAFDDSRRSAGESLANAGVYMIDAQALREVAPPEGSSLERDVVARFAGAGAFGFVGVERFLDIGTPERYREAPAWIARWIEGDSLAAHAGTAGDEAPALERYRKMLLIRRAEEKIQAHYHEDEMKTPVHLCIGQEALAVGVCEALSARDQVVGTYRSHGIYLAKTDDPEGMFAELYGRVSGPGKGRAGSMHLARPSAGLVLTSAVVGTTIPVGVGLAYANRLRRDQRFVAAFFGDGAIDEGVFWESLNFACLKRLSVLFVCEDNGLAIHSRARDRHGYRSIADVVRGFDCRVIETRSTDPGAIASLVRDAIAGHSGDGRPIFLHAHTYRFVEHVGPRIEREFHLGYRDAGEHADWLAREPITTERARLIEGGVAEAQLLAVESAIDVRIAACVASARAAPLPGPELLWQDVFA
jgi:TPP-dependent pyruvate/acetoin dehydrogenase alpha subunit/molybdopterin-guanine dinucleotide biosynthesis protein A